MTIAIENMLCVLNDDETFTALGGCWIADATGLDEGIEGGDNPGNLVRMVERYSLQALVNWAHARGYFGDYPKMMQAEPDE